MPAPEPEKLRLLSLKQVMKRLECSDNTVYRLVKLGRLPQPVRHGGDGPPKWWQEDVERYLLMAYRGEFRDEDAAILAAKQPEKKTEPGGLNAAKPPKRAPKSDKASEDEPEA